MAPKTPSKTKQVTEVKLPEWVNKASEENYNLAADLGTDKFRQYKGPRVAGMDDRTKAAFSFFDDTQDDASKMYGKANTLLSSVAGMNLTPKTVTAGSLAKTDLSPYLNPYIDNVENKSLAALDKSRMMAVNSNASAAQAAGAFGGSRHAITDGVTNAETADKAGLLSAQLRADGYDKAIGAASTDIGNKYTADIANRDASLQAQLAKMANMKDAANGMINTGNATASNNNQIYQTLLQSGMLNQQQAQRVMDSNREKFGEKRDYDLENLNLRLSALGMSPYGKTETANKTATQGSSGTDFATLGLGALQLLFGLSEDSTKTDKEKVGKLGKSGLNLWAYRYKKDPKTYPKVVGVMASEVEEKYPDLVKLVGDKRIINNAALAELL